MFFSKIYMFMIFYSTFMIIGSYNWFISWVGLELATFMVVPFLLSEEKTSALKLVVWKYFVVQTVGSGLMFFSFASMGEGSIVLFNSYINDAVYIIMIIGLLMKMGLTPFHGWMILVVENLPWLKFFLMGSILKLGPLMIWWNFSSFYSSKKIYLSIYIMLMSSLWSLNDFSLRRFLIYSSILNMSWMLSVLSFDKILFMFYFNIYVFIFFCLTWFLSITQVSDYSSMLNSNVKFSFVDRVMFFIMILSFCGMPPFLGFFPKFEIFKTLILNDFCLILILLSVSSMIILFMYVLSFFFSMFFKYSFMMWSEKMFKSGGIILHLMFMMNVWGGAFYLLS